MNTSKYINRLRNKGTSGKISDIFSSLTGEVDKQEESKGTGPSKIVKIKKPRKYKRIPRSYKTYINSHHWRTRRDKFYKEFGRKCAICGETKDIDLHHSFYGNYGLEEDEHLIPLCKNHHFQFHEEIGKSKKDMTKETLKFIEENYNPICG